MITRIEIFLLIFIISVGCKTTDKSDKIETKSNQSANKEFNSNHSSPIDTNSVMEMVANDITQRLKEQQIRYSDFDENGDFYIEFTEDSTNSDPDDMIWWEYFQIEKNELITGELNSDHKPDLAIMSITGPTKGNIFGLEWHIYVSENDGYQRIENNFGGGKFSDLETVVTINEMKLRTEFQEFDEEMAALKDSVEIREYELVENELKRIE